MPSSSVTEISKDEVPLKFRAGVNVQLPAASTVAAPSAAAGAVAIAKFGVVNPSIASVNVAVPATGPASSLPPPIKAPPNVPGSLT